MLWCVYSAEGVHPFERASVFIPLRPSDQYLEADLRRTVRRLGRVPGREYDGRGGESSEPCGREQGREARGE